MRRSLIAALAASLAASAWPCAAGGAAPNINPPPPPKVEPPRVDPPPPPPKVKPPRVTLPDAPRPPRPPKGPPKLVIPKPALGSRPAARVGDQHICPMVTPGVAPVPHVGGLLLPNRSTVFICGLPAASVRDMATCVGPPDSLATGSASVFINGRPAVRMGDMTTHGGTVTTGCLTVLIGR